MRDKEWEAFESQVGRQARGWLKENRTDRKFEEEEFAQEPGGCGSAISNHHHHYYWEADYHFPTLGFYPFAVYFGFAAFPVK